MKNVLTTFMIVATLIFVAAPAIADWNPGDSHKMHYPQLPDPQGWDVNFSSYPDFNILADDWRCTQSGPVEDVHFWFSVQGEPMYPPEMKVEIGNIHVSIHDDVPAGLLAPWSMPGQQRWEIGVPGPEATIRRVGNGDQGWYDPFEGYFNPPPDHFNIYQANIDFARMGIPPDMMFQQEVGNIYWLDLSVDAFGIVDPPDGTGDPEVYQLQVGWKTSQDHFNDAAVYLDTTGAAPQWLPLYDPSGAGGQEHLDMAFVITPEPSTLVMTAAGLLGLAGFAAWRRRKKA